VWLAGASAYAQTSDAEWLAQCRQQRTEQFRHCEVRPITMAATGAIQVDARPNGGVRMTGWDQATIAGSARVQVQAGSQAEALGIAGAIAVAAGGGTLRADGPKTGDGQSWSVSFVLSVPRRTDAEIDSINGPVAISGISGRIRATTTNGPISLEELGGDVRVRATNGPLNIVLSGSSWDGVGLDAETLNGPVKIAVPDGYSAQLRTGTVNGPLHLGIPITLQGEIRGGRIKSIDAAIGAGGAPIRAVTTNGPASVEKR
jgi:hypothetical protein